MKVWNIFDLGKNPAQNLVHNESKKKCLQKNVLIETFTVPYPSETPIICDAHHYYSDFLSHQAEIWCVTPCSQNL